MISPKDVITLRVPYPDTVSDLAKRAHMYICVGASEPSCELVKCQRFKPYHLVSGAAPVRRIVEQPDKSRNPFRHPTVIDLDKLFVVTRPLLSNALKTAQGVNDDLFMEIKAKIIGSIARVALTDAELKAVNNRL